MADDCAQRSWREGNSFNLEDIKIYLRAGSEKTSFGNETDRLLSKLPESGRKEQIKSFHNVFDLASKKLGSHLDKHQAYAYYKAVHVFVTGQFAIVGHDIYWLRCHLRSLESISRATRRMAYIYILYICNYQQVLFHLLWTCKHFGRAWVIVSLYSQQLLLILFGCHSISRLWMELFTVQTHTEWQERISLKKTQKGLLCCITIVV